MNTIADNHLKKALIFNSLSIILVSLTPLLNKFALSYISSNQVAIFNLFFVICFSCLYALVKKESIGFVQNKSLLWIGLFNSIGTISLYIALELLSPVLMGFLGRSYTIFAVLLSYIFLKEKMNRKEWLYIILAISGTYLFVYKNTIGMENVIGIAMSIVSNFFFALTNLLVKINVKEVKSNSILFYNSAISFVFVVIYSLAIGEQIATGIDTRGIGLVFLSSLFNGFLGVLLFYEAIKYLSFSRANVMRLAGPVLVAALSYPFFPVMFTWINIVGVIILLTSVALISLNRR